MDKQELALGLEQAYIRRILVHYYQNFWRDLALRHDRLHAWVRPGKRIPSKADLVGLFAEIMMDRELMDTFFKSLSKGTAALVHNIVWEYPVRVHEFEEVEGITVLQPGHQHYWRSEEQLLPDFQLFKIWNPKPYRYGNQKFDHLTLPEVLRMHLKDLLARPANYDIRVAEEPPKDALRHREDNIFQILELGRFFIEGDHLKTAVRSDKILVSSLKKFAAQAGLKEFYPSGDQSLQWLKTQLILAVIGGIPRKDAPDEPLPLLKYTVSQCFEKKKLSFAMLLLTHLKGGGFLREYPHWENRSIPAEAIGWILNQLPPQSWISSKNILDAVRYRDREMAFQDYIRGMRDLHIKHGRYLSTLSVSRENFHLLMVQPLLKGIMFLLSALGLLEIAYRKPENPVITQDGKTYLSVYDGLTHIKLTPLGAYVFGRSERYEGPVKAVARGEVVVDDKGLILTLRGDDPLKTMVLEQWANPIGGNRFKVDFGSFLKECRSKKDVKSQIARFRNEVCKQPPPVWESFFETALQRVGPLTRSNQWEVYQVDPSPELIDLLATDPFLKSHVLKAEDYHVLIRPSNRKKVVRRLEECGFLITDL